MPLTAEAASLIEKDGAFPAKFIRAAYYQLAEYTEENGEAYYLSLNGK